MNSSSRLRKSLSLLFLLLLGCQSFSRIAPGTSALSLSVEAKPKQGAVQSIQRLYVYDTPLAAKPSGDYERVDYSNLSDIVIWLEPSSTTKLTPPSPITLRLDAAHPYLSLRAACVGQRLFLHNHSSKPDTFYSVSDDNDFTLSPISPGGSAEYTVRAPGDIEILSDTTHEPVAHIYAVPTPFFAVAHSNSKVTFDDVPPGPCKILSYHPRLPGSETSVDLPTDQRASATIQVGVNALPQVP
jgi:hypothetical protein